MFDYVVVIGGLLYLGLLVGDVMFVFICVMVEVLVMFVGICIGVFVLMWVGIMNGYCICVSWFYYWDFVECFLGVDECNIVVD